MILLVFYSYFTLFPPWNPPYTYVFSHTYDRVYPILNIKGLAEWGELLKIPWGCGKTTTH